MLRIMTIAMNTATITVIHKRTTGLGRGCASA
jgi:hypothetical protein